jgi:hypothetical protein
LEQPSPTQSSCIPYMTRPNPLFSNTCIASPLCRCRVRVPASTRYLLGFGCASLHAAGRVQMPIPSIHLPLRRTSFAQSRAPHHHFPTRLVVLRRSSSAPYFLDLSVRRLTLSLVSTTHSSCCARSLIESTLLLALLHFTSRFTRRASAELLSKPVQTDQIKSLQVKPTFSRLFGMFYTPFWSPIAVSLILSTFARAFRSSRCANPLVWSPSSVSLSLSLSLSIHLPTFLGLFCPAHNQCHTAPPTSTLNFRGNNCILLITNLNVHELHRQHSLFCDKLKR